MKLRLKKILLNGKNHYGNHGTFCYLNRWIRQTARQAKSRSVFRSGELNRRRAAQQASFRAKAKAKQQHNDQKLSKNHESRFASEINVNINLKKLIPRLQFLLILTKEITLLVSLKQTLHIRIKKSLIIFGRNVILVTVSSGKGGGKQRGWAVKSLVSAERAQ